VDTHVGRRKDRSKYQATHQEDIQLLVSEDLARYARDLQVDVRKFLFFFRYLRADAVLWNGLCIGRGGPRVSD